jgi:TolB-like protein/DNA-binding CsgD family transcriptional regulator
LIARDLPSLTRRQAEVFALIMQGKSNKAIGRSLGLSEPTVKHHVTAVLKALKVTSRTEAILAMASRTSASASVAAAPAKDGRRGVEPLLQPDKPSIVVLPFDNLSGEGDTDYFADGMVEDITVALGRWSWLFVIASRSAFAYKGRTLDVRRVGAELAVRYVLTGSVRKDDRRVRIVVQLSDASDGLQIWADRFEGKLDDIFDIQDQVASHVAGMVAPALRSVETQRAQRKPTESLTAYDLFLRALQHIHRGEPANLEALRLLYQAIELDPSYCAAYGLAAWCYRLRKVNGWVAPSDPSLAEGVRLARLTAANTRRDSEGLWMAANALAHLSGEFDLGLTMIEESLSVNPNSAGAWWAGGMLHSFLGNDAEAMMHLETAHRFNPLDTQPHIHWIAVAYAHFMAGRYADAERVVDRIMSKTVGATSTLRVKIAACGLLGRSDEGREAVNRLLEIDPAASLVRLKQYWETPLRRNPRALQDFLVGARLSGLPEGE